MEQETPWQLARAAAEETGVWPESWGPFHRHFANDAIHRDGGPECDQPGTPRRVYVFDADNLDEHEQAVAQYAIRHPEQFAGSPPVAQGRINLRDAMPMARVTVRVEQPDGRGLEFTWPGAICLDFALDELRTLDPVESLWQLEDRPSGSMAVRFTAVPVRDASDPHDRPVEVRLLDVRAADSAGAGQGLPPVAPPPGCDAAAGAPG